MTENNQKTFADYEREADEIIKQLQSDSFDVIQQKLERLAVRFEQFATKPWDNSIDPDTSASVRWSHKLLGRLVEAVGKRLAELNHAETAEFCAVGDRIIKAVDALWLRLTNFAAGLERFENLEKSDFRQ